MKIKITTGFNADEKFIIDSDEAHKAYYLFNNPELRGTFSNGVALIGRDIRSIQPAWNEIMGWNPTHKIDEYDWNEIRSKGIDNKVNKVLELAQDTARLAQGNVKILELPLSEIKQLPQNNKKLELNENVKSLADKFKV